jgi:imidazolonepropionase-like amidohydrolase
VVFLFASPFATPDLPAQGRGVTLAFTNVTVIDVRDGVARPDVTVVVSGDRITAVGATDEVEIPPDATVIDGSGKYLIPGLWDMHVHVSHDDSRTRSLYLPLFVAHGVTGIREMSGQSFNLRQREEIAAGTLLGPRMVVGKKVDGPNPWPTHPAGRVVKVAHAEEARRVVDSLSAEGYDFVKPYQFLSAEVYRALHEQGRAIGMEVSGEIPMSVSLWEAAALGHPTVEHLTGVELACSGQEEELRVKYRRQAAELAADTTLRTHIPVWNHTEWESLATWDPEKCRALYRHLVAHGTWVVPTLVTLRHVSYPANPDIRNDPRQRYLPPGEWDPEGVADWYDPERRLRPTYEHRLRTLVDLHQAGVGILAGTDFPAGFMLHDELALYVESGLSPLDALRTATLNPARYLGATDSLGTVEAGKIADLVLLDANPLEDISNTHRIAGVVLGGRYFDRQELDALLAQAEAAADASREPSGASQAQPSGDGLEAAVRAEVEEQHRREQKAFVEGDCEMVVSFYSDEATIYRGGRRVDDLPQRGKTHKGPVTGGSMSSLPPPRWPTARMSAAPLKRVCISPPIWWQTQHQGPPMDAIVHFPTAAPLPHGPLPRSPRRTIRRRASATSPSGDRLGARDLPGWAQPTAGDGR